MSIGQRRPFQAGRPNDLSTILPPPPEYFESAWLDSPERIRAKQERRLLRRLYEAMEIPFYDRLWSEAGFSPDHVNRLDDLAIIPTYTVDDIRRSLERAPPLGDYQAVDVRDARREPLRLFFSGGTTGEPRPTLYTQWDRDVHGILLSRQLYIQGIRPGDVVLNAWAYNTHNGAHAYDEALYRWLNCVPITTGTGKATSTRKQVEFAHRFKAKAMLTTGDYLLRFANVAEEMGYDIKEDFEFAALPNIGDRDALQDRFGLPLLHSYGFHEVGCVAVECPAQDGLHIFEDAFIVEVVDPDTGDPVEPGTLGALVVTDLVKSGNAQIRYNIMDLSYLYPPGRCECGSWLRRMAPFQGRGDNMVKLRGVNVWPEAVGRATLQVPGSGEDYFVRAFRNGDSDELEVFVTGDRSGVDAAEVSSLAEERLRDQFGLRMSVHIVDPQKMDQMTEADSVAKLKRFQDDRPSSTR